MYLLGIDVGTSSVKISVIDVHSHATVASAQYPEKEAEIITLKPGWAEQSPESWWSFTQAAILEANQTGNYDPKDIVAIGIAYQMHGLVMVDSDLNVLRRSIIWCDSRAVELGDKAFDAIGAETCLGDLLNSPGNFTASKLAWVKENEPDVYAKAWKVMLPGDFIAMKLSGEITTSSSALSEGIFWNFRTEALSQEVMDYFGFDGSLIPEVKPVFSEHGRLRKAVAELLGMREGIPIAYKAGDQPNNALTLNVMKPGEVAATAGTSGVIYAVSDCLVSDRFSRVNTFAHVNHLPESKRLGVLLCINGTGILNKWMRNTLAEELSYPEINALTEQIAPGSSGLRVLPFGNGAERMLRNRLVGSSVANIDYNCHSQAHLFRAAQEGIAFAFRYGLDILRENGMNPGLVRASQANLFLSNTFTSSFVNATGLRVELYDGNGSVGAAIGAGVGAKVYADADEAFSQRKPISFIEPDPSIELETAYQEWKELLDRQLA